MLSAKNRQHISRFTLYLYAFSIIISALHFHPNITNRTETIADSVPNSANNFTDPYADAQSNCSLAQFAHSYYSNNNTDITWLSYLPLLQEAGIIVIVQDVQDFKYYSNNFRAPPIS